MGRGDQYVAQSQPSDPAGSQLGTLETETECVAQWVKPPLSTPASRISWNSGHFTSQLPDNAPAKAVDDGPSAWGPATHTGDRAPGFSRAGSRLLRPFRE